MDILDILELSPLQQGLLFHALRDPKSSAYFEQLNCALRGSLDMESFQRAWEHVVSRHDALRSALQWEDLEKPYQIVYSNASLPFVVEDWTALSESQQQERLPRFLEEDRGRGFDLTSAPLVRIAVIKMSEQRHQLVFSFHHLLLDGWSLTIIVSEVFRAYEAYRRDTSPQLEKARSFREYIAWLQQQDQNRAETFWRDTLRGFVAPNALRMDPDKRATTDYARRKRKLPAGVRADLERVARKLQVTVNVVIQAAWSLLLSRYTAQDDVVWGTTVSGRPAGLPHVEQMVGIFINTLPLRTKVNNEESFHELVSKLQRYTADVTEFEYAPLALIQTWSEVPRSGPLFETLVVFENYPVNESVQKIGSSLELEGAQAFERTNYPLSLLVSPGEQLSLEFYYETARFDSETIDRMLRQLELVLEQVIADPQAKVGSITLLDDRDKEQILHGWNASAVELTDTSTIQQLFEKHAARTPDKPAVIFEGEQLTFAELDERSNQVAHALMSRNVVPGALVGLLVERSLNCIVGLLGILKAGAAYVPIDTSYPLDRVKFVLQDAAVRVVVTTDAFAQKLADLALDFITFDGGAAYLAAQPTTKATARVTSRDLAYAIYTSGSTGRPKGVMIEHGGLTNLMEAQFRAFGLTSEDRVFQFASLAYDASIFEIAMAWKTGATLCLASPEATLSPIALAQQLRSQRITNLTIPPSVLSTVTDTALPDLRVIVVAGEACPADLVDKWAEGRRFFNCYGPTETTVWATYAECKPGVERPPIGKAVANAQVYILDADLRPVPVGVAGELHIGGAGVGRGYINRPDLTAKKFIRDIFSKDPEVRLYKSGDLARWLPDGNVAYMGRIDHQVKLRGFRLELEEIEAVLVQCPGVAEAAVLLREDPGSEKRLVGYVVCEKGNAPTIGEVRDFLRKQLPHFMVPATFVTLETMPLTTNGKINRRALPAPSGSTGDVSAAPQSALERQIAEVWKSVLNVEQVGRDDNFFDLGGHSLLLTQLQTRLKKATGRSVSVVELLRSATVRSLAAYLSRGEQQADATPTAPAPETAHEPIAVIGMAGRFPSAPSVDAFWQKLRNGEECITRFTDEELIAAGVDPALLAHPNYVKAGGKLDDVESFDGNFFGFNPREVESIDPQQRIFLETSHEALENAGCDPVTFDGRIAVFGGATHSSYMSRNLAQNPDAAGAIGDYQIGIGNHKDFLATRVSYKLNLKGPAVAVQATCCTGLVAIHYACQALWTNEAEMALAGGVSVTFPHPSGYLYHEEGILSPDGHCRAFDAKAKGTVPGNGVGVVVLKRLSRAIQDGDTIHAVILGSATNNDGSAKVGYTAPSIDGQAAVIRMAHASAGITADSVGYVEAHGTGTALGDPIEIGALTEAFRATTDRTQFCAVGSVKTNAGHMDCAAGVGGFIKTVLQLKSGEIVPSLNFEAGNPKIDFETSPFYVNNKLSEWRSEGPRRAGVSSFGIGGTNVHVVVQEPPRIERRESSSRDLHLLTFSAKTATALDTLTSDNAAFLDANPQVDIANVAFTQHVGRTAHNFRRIAIVRDREDAVRVLTDKDPQSVFTAPNVPPARSVVFLFSGQGAQYVNMGRELYEREPLYRELIDEGSSYLEPFIGLDLRKLLFANEQRDSAGETLKQTCYTQPALFLTEYALACLWMKWGIRPAAMLGHSIGEYVAACLSGVLEFKDALRLVSLRGKLMQRILPGAMLALPLSESDARALLLSGTSIAAVNAPAMCVASGPFDRIEELERVAVQKGIECRKLHTSHAFHSAMMDPILEEFAEVVRSVKFSPPTLPYISNVTGTWIRHDDVTDPEYWTRHLRHTVRFSAGIATLIEQEARIFLEVGPGQALTTLARQQPEFAAKNVAFGSLRHPNSTDSDVRFLTATLGRLWLAGANVDWRAYHANEKRNRIALPTYPFEKRRYFVEPKKSSAEAKSQGIDRLRRRADISEWFYLPSWKRAPLVDKSTQNGRTVLVLSGETSLSQELTRELKEAGSDVVVVHDSHASKNGSAVISNINDAAEYKRLFASLSQNGKLPSTIVNLWGVTGGAALPTQNAKQKCFFGLMALAQAASEYVNADYPVSLFVVTDGVQNVNGTERLNPEKALVGGIVNVLGQELQHSAAKWIDIDSANDTREQAKHLVQELSAPIKETVVAHRGAYRWTQTFEPFPLKATKGDPSILRERGVYLITGGMGGMGLVIAKYLADRVQARLVLVGRTALPERMEWELYLSSHDADDATASKIRAIREMEAAGAEVFVAGADVSHLSQMRNVIARAESRFGPIHGVIHAAGLPGDETLLTKTIENANAIMQAKIEGTLVLDELASHPLDFLVLCSSLASVAAAYGQSDYSAANGFMDAFAQAKSRAGKRVVSINWDTWGDTGMAVTFKIAGHLEGIRRERLKEAITSSEGAEAFVRALQSGEPQVFVSTKDLNGIMRQMREPVPVVEESVEEAKPATSMYPRPPLDVACVAPRNPMEKKLVDIWQELLGVEPVGVHDNFFDLGGHSLLATQVIARIHKNFDYEMPLRKLFEVPTIAGISQLISESKPATQEDMQDLLDMVDQLSDEEVAAELERRALDTKKAANA